VAFAVIGVSFRVFAWAIEEMDDQRGECDFEGIEDQHHRTGENL
jgi:hypothetical protein